MGSYCSNSTNTPDTPVKAFDFNDKVRLVGEYKSMGEAARKLYIRSSSAIHSYVYRRAKKKRGVSNYKTEDKYHFELC